VSGITDELDISFVTKYVDDMLLLFDRVKTIPDCSLNHINKSHHSFKLLQKLNRMIKLII